MNLYKETKGGEFFKLLEESFKKSSKLEGFVKKGKVVAVENDSIIVDVGLKSEGIVPLRELDPTKSKEIKAGDNIEVFVERFEGRSGNAILSYEKAQREDAWEILSKSFENKEVVTGIIKGKIRGGFSVELSKTLAFLPGSQLDVRPIDVESIMNKPQTFQIIKMDKKRNNIVVSRRSVIEGNRQVERGLLLSKIKEGDILEGMVKNLTDYGAFVDLGGMDGLIHVTDISWQRIEHPSEILSLGKKIKVKIIKFDQEQQKISLGLKQLQPDPWDKLIGKYVENNKYTGKVTKVTDYGAFVELEPGIEGLIHISEMTWSKSNIHPGKIVSNSQDIEIIILDIDKEKRRIGLGLKQCQENPWKKFSETYPKNTEIEGTVKHIAEFGLFIGLPTNVDGMVHLSDLDWEQAGEEAIKKYKKGDKVKAKIIDIDPESQKISLGIKQLVKNPLKSSFKDIKIGDTITCNITKLEEDGIHINTANKLQGYIEKLDLSQEKSEQRVDRFAVGERVDAVITKVDQENSRLILSIKAREVGEEKKAAAKFGSSDSGASLSNILDKGSEKKDKKNAVSKKEKPEGKKKNQAKKVDQKEKKTKSKS
ncbi:MAG TPA: 30S ribosomal protein S1 [Alphaproteobacteria bacterium]|nr:30S ribosomal protein S1 [Alphaproteobacteria bacterium]